MSEYQYYEFAAVDQPLTKAQMSKLRAISSRARITPRRFTNTYNWGDFKGDPDELMEEFFDAHLYTSNFGYRKLCLRVSAATLDLASVKDYLVDECLGARESRGNLILQFSLNDDPGEWDDDYEWDDREEYYDPDDEDDYDDDDHHEDDDDFDADDNQSATACSQRSLDALLALRDELARGDLRALYLAWLGAAQTEHLDDDATEPPVPPGLANLTSAQRTLAQFLHIRADLIQAAAEKSAVLKPISKTEQREQRAREQETLRVWIAALPAAQKDAWLERIAATATATTTAADPSRAGDPAAIAAEMRRDFLNFLEIQRKAKSANPANAASSATAAATAAAKAASRRTVQALLQRMEEMETVRKQHEAEEAARAAAERARQAAAAREKYLDRQSARESELWPAVLKHIATRLPNEYDIAVALLIDLRDLARRRGKDAHAAFVTQLCELKDTWRSRHGLIKRIDTAFAKPDAAQRQNPKSGAGI